MKENAAIKIIVARTLCLAFLLWGTIYVARTVVNNNYHAPKPLSAVEQRTKALSDCASTQARSEDCAKVVK